MIVLWAVTSHQRPPETNSVTLKLEAPRFAETFEQSSYHAWSNNPEVRHAILITAHVQHTLLLISFPFHVTYGFLCLKS
jgi:hypothetical protein